MGGAAGKQQPTNQQRGQKGSHETSKVPALSKVNSQVPLTSAARAHGGCVLPRVHGDGEAVGLRRSGVSGERRTHQSKIGGALPRRRYECQHAPSHG